MPAKAAADLPAARKGGLPSVEALASVRGQHDAKRALEIAAAGGRRDRSRLPTPVRTSKTFGSQSPSARSQSVSSIAKAVARHTEAIAGAQGTFNIRGVGQGDLTGTRQRAAADQPGWRDRVMRRPERPLAHEPAVVHADDALDPGDLERLVEVGRRQEPRQAPRQHRLARARRSEHQDVVAAPPVLPEASTGGSVLAA